MFTDLILVHHVLLELSRQRKLRVTLMLTLLFAASAVGSLGPCFGAVIEDGASTVKRLRLVNCSRDGSASPLSSSRNALGDISVFVSDNDIGGAVQRDRESASLVDSATWSVLITDNQVNPADP